MVEETIASIDEFTRNLVKALNDCAVQYMLIGGIPAMHYGRPRSTVDCDVAIFLKEEDIPKFCACLTGHGFEVDEKDVQMAFKEKSHFNAYRKSEYGFRADFSWKKTSLDEYGFKRAKKLEVFGVTAIVEAPEDIIIAKLVYGSQQDFEDAAAILKRQKNLDINYLQSRAIQENITAPLEKLFKFVEKWK